MLAALNFGW